MLKGRIFLFILSLAGVVAAFAQRPVLRGTVTDSITGETLPYAPVRWEGTSNGPKTALAGRYPLP